MGTYGKVCELCSPVSSCFSGRTRCSDARNSKCPLCRFGFSPQNNEATCSRVLFTNLQGLNALTVTLSATSDQLDHNILDRLREAIAAAIGRTCQDPQYTANCEQLTLPLNFSHILIVDGDNDIQTRRSTGVDISIIGVDSQGVSVSSVVVEDALNQYGASIQAASNISVSNPRSEPLSGSNPSPSAGSKSASPIGAIVGGIVGGVLVCCLAAWLLVTRNRKRHELHRQPSRETLEMEDELERAESCQMNMSQLVTTGEGIILSTDKTPRSTSGL
jgi:hypothetical protein